MHCSWQCKMVQPLWKTVWQFSKNLNLESNTIQQFHFWVYTQKQKKKERTQTGSLYTDVHSYIVHNGQKRNRNNPNVYQDVWIDKQNVTFTYSGLFFNLEKEERSESCYSLDEPWMHYTKRIKPGTNGQIVYNSTYIRYIE